MAKTVITRAQQAALDFEGLMLDQRFLRTLYTILETAGMFTGNFHSDGRIHAMSEGRRSLGADILRTAERYAGPEALMRILAEEMKTLQESPHGNGSDYSRERNRELGGPDPDLREPGTGLTYLSYD